MVHHGGTSLGCLIVLLTGKCEPFIYAALLSEANSVLLATRGLWKLLGWHQPPATMQGGGGGRARNGFFARLWRRWAAPALFRGAVWPLLLATFAVTRVYVHLAALRQSARLLASGFGSDSSEAADGSEAASGVTPWQRRLLGGYGVACGLAICYLNAGLLRSLVRADWPAGWGGKKRKGD